MILFNYLFNYLLILILNIYYFILEKLKEKYKNKVERRGRTKVLFYFVLFISLKHLFDWSKNKNIKYNKNIIKKI